MSASHGMEIVLRVRAGEDEQVHELRVTAEERMRATNPDAVGSAGKKETLAGFLARRGFPLNTRCGERGLCSGCMVFLDDIAEPVRACQILFSEASEVFERITIPTRSLLRQQPSVVDDFRINIPMARDPLGDGARYGAAVDVGTTTVALIVCDLENGKMLGRASTFNAQIKSGEDVLTRIQVCLNTGVDGVRLLQSAVMAETIQPLLAEACAKAGIATDDVGVMVIAGNTTMQHLVAGENPAPMGVHPFTPVFLEYRDYAAKELGLEFGKCSRGRGRSDGPSSLGLSPEKCKSDEGPSLLLEEQARVHLLPGLSSYVGADLTAGVIATGMIYEDGPSLLVDVGTNGEIVAKVGKRLVGCATAAGPAFEGAGLTCGTRAVRGAIERVRMRVNADGIFEMKLDVIGSKNGAGQDNAPKPVGLCGSAYIDFLWEARRAGLLLENGRFLPQGKLPAGAHVEADDRGRKLRIHEYGASGPLWVSELDVVKLLQAKAAIGAGIETLLKVLGIGARDVKRLYLAGGFGMHLSLEHAVGCGTLPGFAPEQIQVVGNTSLGGAFLAMNDRSLLGEMQEACRNFEAVELNLQPGFEDAYIDHLSLM